MRQAQALHLMNSGQSVFLTGPAGSGKTYVLSQFIAQLKKSRKGVAVTASTGIAATHIGGTTIHSWSGLGIRDKLEDKDKVWLGENARLIKRYNQCDVLIIDEVSMLHGARLDMVNTVCKLLRKSDEPFGGLQVILTGDLFQLPPVNRTKEPDDFAHLSPAWQELRPQVCYLTEQHRQGNDDLLAILQAMRAGEIEDYHQETLRSRLNTAPDDQTATTRLYAHNVDVEALNQTKLDEISAETEAYGMVVKGNKQSVEQLQKSVLAPAVLELKLGAEVMFVANNFQLGFVNGTRGKVVKFREDTPLVRLQSNGRIIAVEPHTWSLDIDGRTRAEVAQLPLRLAWAITIHKSQGMSLDSALVDLSRSFTPGMGYVALSRVRSLKGLYLCGINAMAMRLHPDIYDYDKKLQALSAQLALRTPDFDQKAVDMVKKSSKKIDSNLLVKLKTWRTERAKSDKVSPFIVAHNTLLEELAHTRPANAQQLLRTKGFGTKKLETYGSELLTLLQR